MPVSSRRDFLRLAAFGFGLLLAGHVRAEGIQLIQAEVIQKGEMFHLAGHYAIQLSPTLENALQRGVQITFVQQVEGERERDWWLSEGLIEQERRIRVAYNALLRQYYVTVSGVSSNHDTLDDALRAAGDLRDWAVLSTRQMKKRSSYRVQLRMQLDLSQLPKPLQVNALSSSGRWQLDSGWQEREFKY